MAFEFKQKMSEEVFNIHYCLHGETSVEEVLHGVADMISMVESEDKRAYYANEFYELMVSGKLMPAGRFLANARLNSPMKNLMNCYVLGIGDSMVEIYDTMSDDAMVGKMGGGVGIDFSPLRPKGASISKGGESSGVLSFMEIFDASAKAIHTGGQRRAAHMGVLRCDHPDIEEFVTYKHGDVNGRLTQFNISVGITDEFLTAVENDTDWDLVFEGKVYKTIKATYLYSLIIQNMYTYNEPGVLFLDTVNRMNNGWYMYQLSATNPCGEEPLPAGGSCCLSSLNLSEFVTDPFTEQACFDMEGFVSAIHTGVRFLDDALEASEYPLPSIREQVLSERRIGLGFTGLGDMLIKMRLKYGSEESLEAGRVIAEVLCIESYSASVELAKEKGAFPTYDQRFLDSSFMNVLPYNLKADIKTYGIRNIALNTCAPTGTTSLSLGNNCSSGIEPVFAMSYTRNVRQPDDTFIGEKIYSKVMLEYLEATNDGSGNTVAIPDYFVTSDEVSIDASLQMQAVFQKYVDASISKTITLPDTFTEEEYHGLILKAWKLGLKGITTYNPKGALKPILVKDSEDTKSDWRDVSVVKNSVKRPQELPCDVHTIQVNHQPISVLVGKLDSEPYEVFLTRDQSHIDTIGKIKSGLMVKRGSKKYDLMFGDGRVAISEISKTDEDDLFILCRMVSLALRHRIPLEFIIGQLNKTSKFDALSKSLARVLKKYIKDGEAVVSHPVCPVCGDKLVFQDGCVLCQSCGWSKC